MKKILSVLMILLLLLSSCTKVPVAEQTDTDTETEKETAAAQDMFSERDNTESYDENTAVKILLSGDTAQCDSRDVSVDGGNITIKKEGTYTVSGQLENGSVIVDALATEKIQIVLNSADITSSTNVPLFIKQADKVVITLAHGSENSLTAGDSFEAVDGINVDGALFSKDDLTINGEGSLVISSPAGHGIVVKDDFTLTGGSLDITSASHGIDANDSVRVEKGSVNIKSGKDGVHAENTDDTSLGFVYIQDGNFDIEAQGDGISASAYMEILGGEFTLVTGGGSENAQKQTSDGWGGMPGGMPGGMARPGGKGDRGSMVMPTAATAVTQTDDGSTSIKGLKASGDLKISGGSFKINSADDAVHSNSSVTVSGGSFEISSGDDGFHADSVLDISNGSINITECYEGLEALDLKVSGGEISLVASDDGINAAGGTDSSGFGGARGDEQFGGPGGPGGFGGGMNSSSKGSILLSGGNIYLESSGDGIDANGTFEMTGGNVTVCGPTRGDTATLDYDVSATVSGGTFIGTGGAGMAQTFSEAKQGLISVSVGNQTAGTQIQIKDKSGKTLISHTPRLDFAVVIVSSAELKSGENYTVCVGEQSAEFEAQ